MDRHSAVEPLEADSVLQELLSETYRPEGGEIVMRELQSVRNERDQLRRNMQKIMDIFECWENTPQPSIDELCEWIRENLAESAEHLECPITCELCGERLADTDCEHCHGSGCGPGTASGAYEECEWCAGVGKVHPGCVEKSYAELVTENAQLEWFRMPVENLEIINGWLVQRGAHEPEYPAGPEYGAAPYGDADLLINLATLPGWPDDSERELYGSLADAAREYVECVGRDDKYDPEEWSQKFNAVIVAMNELDTVLGKDRGDD